MQTYVILCACKLCLGVYIYNICIYTQYIYILTSTWFKSILYIYLHVDIDNTLTTYISSNCRLKVLKAAKP